MRLFFILFFLSYCLFTEAQTLNSSNLPLIIINTQGQQIEDEPKIMADMGIIYNGDGQRNNLTDAFNEYNGKIGIEIRGQSSQMFPMKSYSIELWDDDSAGIDQSLFGLPEESDWVLYAPYTDKTLMRNFLAYTMSNSLGHWAAHCRFAELILNNEYKGVYVFMEKIKRDAGRVNIKKMNATDISNDAVTGGYIFSIDKEPDGWFSKYHPDNNPNSYIQYSYVYPKLEDIVQQQKDYIQSYVDSFENTLSGPSFQDPVNGFRKFADEASFIDYLIVNEVSRNVDGYRLSSYFYKDRNSINRKIIAGPVWDYDIAFRNADYCNGSLTSGWAYDFNDICAGDYFQIPFWWDRLLQDTAFKSHLLCRWKEVRSTVLSNQAMMSIIDSVKSLLGEASQRHFVQWPILGQYVWPNPQPIPTSYTGEINALKEWLINRIGWMDRNMSNTGSCSVFNWPANNSSTVIIKTPNPVTSFHQLSIESKENQKILVRIIDMQGRILQSATTIVHEGSNELPFAKSLYNLKSGIYIIQVITAKGERVAKKLIRY